MRKRKREVNDRQKASKARITLFLFFGIAKGVVEVRGF
jgi:hypothetical protein